MLNLALIRRRLKKGTGGTIAGVSKRLKELNAKIRVVLADPPGSGFFNKVTRGAERCLVVHFIANNETFYIELCFVHTHGRLLIPCVGFRIGVMFAHTEREGKRKRSQVDTIVEGIGLNRVTHNFNMALIDDAVRVSDEEAVEMSRLLMREEGKLFLSFFFFFPRHLWVFTAPASYLQF
jgi:cysteine synthase A